MTGTLDDHLARSLPGAWRDAILAYGEARDAHVALFARGRAAYDAFYDLPETMRGGLPDDIVATVSAIEASVVALCAVRDRLPEARDAAFVAELGRLGSEPRADGEPDWVRLLRDLHALRSWRVAHLDGVDVHLPPFLLANRTRREAPGLLDRAMPAWTRAMGGDASAARGRVVELARAGLVPGVADAPDRHSHHVPEGPAMDRAFEAIIEADGAERLLAEVRNAAEALPSEAFPAPDERMRILAAHVGASPTP